MKYLLIDGNNLIYRAHFAKSLTDKKGQAVSGIFGVMRMVVKLVRKHRPDHCIIAWDLGKSRERLKIYPEYKANRDSRDPQIKKDIARQARVCQKLFKHLPVRQIVVDGVEADDIIGLLCDRLNAIKTVVSNDHDFIQLVERDVTMHMPDKDKLLTYSNVEKFLGFPVQHYVVWKSMVGDTSDNIKGIAGVGVKTATKIIVEGVEGNKKRKVTTEEQKILDRNSKLMTIGAVLTKKQRAEIKRQFKSEKKQKLDIEKVRTAFAKYGFKSLYHNFDEWVQPLRGLKW